jgi:hypothetical protein
VQMIVIVQKMCVSMYKMVVAKWWLTSLESKSLEQEAMLAWMVLAAALMACTISSGPCASTASNSSKRLELAATSSTCHGNTAGRKHINGSLLDRTVALCKEVGGVQWPSWSCS